MMRFCFLAYDVGQQQVPSCNEGPDFTHSHIAVQIGGASFGHTGAELGVTQPSEHGRHGGDEEGDDDAGARRGACDLAREHVDTSTQRTAHAQRHQVQCGQAAAEFRALAIRLQRLHPGQTLQEGQQLRARHPGKKKKIHLFIRSMKKCNLSVIKSSEMSEDVHDRNVNLF